MDGSVSSGRNVYELDPRTRALRVGVRAAIRLEGVAPAPTGGLYVVETMSVIAQVISYRGFRRRVLRMAPIHHHFEVGGWSEFTVIVRFWLFSAICVAAGIGIFYADFLRFGLE